MTVEELRRDAYRRRCDWIAIDRLVGSVEFEETWAEALDAERIAALKIIQLGDRLGVQKWFREQRRRHILGKSLRELRRIAQLDGVPNYHSLSKDDLISLLGGAA